MPHDLRDQIVNFLRRWSEKTEIGTGRFIAWLGVTTNKFYDWRERCTGSCEKKILDRDGWRCQHCGTSENLQVHHISPEAALETTKKAI